MLDHMYVSLLNTIGWIVRIVITVTLPMTIDPRLVLLVFFALPTVLSSAWRPGVDDRSRNSSPSTTDSPSTCLRRRRAPPPPKRYE